MGDPVGAARYAKRALADDGTVMLVEPFANDRVEDNLNTVGRLYYSASTTLCCAHSLSENGAAALGAQAGEARLADVFTKAGFQRVQKSQGDAVQLDSRSEGLESRCRKLGSCESTPYGKRSVKRKDLSDETENKLWCENAKTVYKI